MASAEVTVLFFHIIGLLNKLVPSVHVHHAPSGHFTKDLPFCELRASRELLDGPFAVNLQPLDMEAIEICSYSISELVPSAKFSFTNNS